MASSIPEVQFRKSENGAILMNKEYKNFVELCFYCHNYQRRLIWTLSSIFEQVNAPSFTVSVAHVEGNGDPSTESVLQSFSQVMQIREIIYKNYEDMQFRSDVRSEQVKQSESEWLLFLDSDRVYHPNMLHDFFDKISQLPFEHRVYGIVKEHAISLPFVQDIIENQKDLYINNAYENASKFPFVIAGRKKVAGNFMAVRRESLNLFMQDRYSTGKRFYLDRPIHRQMTCADIEMRHVLGEVIIPLDPKQIHLSHYHAKDQQYSINEQR